MIDTYMDISSISSSKLYQFAIASIWLVSRLIVCTYMPVILEKYWKIESIKDSLW